MSAAEMLDDADELPPDPMADDLAGWEQSDDDDDDAPPTSETDDDDKDKRPPRWALQERGKDRGVYLIKDTNGAPSGEPTKVWICAPLKVRARARTIDGSGWGRLLAWEDHDGREHEWVCPDADLGVGDGLEVLRYLKSHGLKFYRGAARHVLDYIGEQSPRVRLRSVESPGWVRGTSVYVAADGAVHGSAPDGEGFRYQPQRGEEHGLSSSGSLATWKTEVAARCVGNSRLVVAVCTAFAAPLLRLSGAQGGGWHFVGASSTGKTTAIEVAASVLGFPGAAGEQRGYVRSWDATKNGLAILAAAHNDAVLCVDEIGQASARDLGEILYLVSNGQERTRSTADARIKSAARWSVLMLSAGEKDVAVAIEEGGKTPRAGQDARLPSIPADTGSHGMFEELHGLSDGRSLADALARATRATCGVAWPTWLAWLTSTGREALTDRIRHGADAFVAKAAPLLGTAPAGEVHRVVARFALCAVAGELATEAGLTGWPVGEAERGMFACLNAWLERREGPGAADKRRLLSHIRGIVEMHLSSRFDLRTPPPGLVRDPEVRADADPRPTRDRLGFRDADNAKIYVLSDTFRTEYVSGIVDSVETAVRYLTAAGWLVRGDKGRPRTNVRIPALGDGTVRVYVLDVAKIVGAEE